MLRTSSSAWLLGGDVNGWLLCKMLICSKFFSAIFLHGCSIISFWTWFQDYLQERCKGSILYGFRGGPAGIMKCKYVVLNSEYIYPYRNQVSLILTCYKFSLIIANDCDLLCLTFPSSSIRQRLCIDKKSWKLNIFLLAVVC